MPKRDESEEIKKEAVIHGAAWGKDYGGYFADPRVAEAFIEELERALGARPAAAAADLGGGTGFVLTQLMQRGGLSGGRRYVDIDLSEAQLGQVSDPRIEKHCVSLTEFTRSLIGSETEEILFCTRSTMHYFGIFGLKPLLGHIRAQMRTGEIRSLCEKLKRDYPQSRLLEKKAEEWVLSAPYWIWTCRAV